MRIAIVQFPGSNCERETSLAVKRAGMEPVECLWNTPKEIAADFDGYILVGGFSYEDRSRAGIIAALDPIMDTIREQSERGKPILGICNGAQILVEKGLVPGLRNNEPAVALTDNIRTQNNKILGYGYYNAWVKMRLSDNAQKNVFTRHLTPKNILTLPVAHAEGRFVIPPKLLEEMQHNGQNVFQYCDSNGNIFNEFPVNPNGSVDNIAAISNRAGNVLAIMPHPERTSACDALLHSMRDSLAEGCTAKIQLMHHEPASFSIQPYASLCTPHSYELILDTIITDNHAVSVENTIRNRGISVQIRRYVHWEVICDSCAVFEKIKAAGLLFNDQKETVVSPDDVKESNSVCFLVRPKEDIQGKQTQQILERHFSISGVRVLSKSILWKISPCGKLDPAVKPRDDNDKPRDDNSKPLSSRGLSLSSRGLTAGSSCLTTASIPSHILYNPNSHDCYQY